MKTVVTYGTFDLFHVGHVRLLKRLRGLGDRLIVGCSTDEFNEKKGKRTVMPYAQREELLLGCRYVDDVFPEKNWEQKRSDITKYKVDIFAIGDDWSGHFDSLQDICEVMYLPRTSGISSTDVKKLVVSRFKNELVSIATELQNVEKRLRSLTEIE
ncbi:MAG: adenylyltransferase/cytidyltransferase family protein [Rhodobacteraceae bacterium]|nr:adenylyltransferase/cytidyltransferase family protein [Paracoccaceae bacterium]